MSQTNPLAVVKRVVAGLLSAIGLNTPARVVIAVSPLLTVAAGWIASLAARYLPGLPALSSGEITDVFVAGATLAATKVLLWLYGAQKIDVIHAIHDSAILQAHDLSEGRVGENVPGSVEPFDWAKDEGGLSEQVSKLEDPPQVHFDPSQTQSTIADTPPVSPSDDKSKVSPSGDTPAPESHPTRL